MDSFITILCFVVAILIYFLPTIIALGRKHNYKWLILILNLFGAFQSFICGNISIDSDKQELYDVVNRGTFQEIHSQEETGLPNVPAEFGKLIDSL